MKKRTKNKNKNKNSDYDSAWKEIIEIYFPQFVEFFYPELHKLIDYKKGYEFLDKQLLQIVSDSKIGNREVDKLVKVFLKDGKELWILFHIEVQVQKEKIRIIEKRMFIYYYKTFEKFEHDVVSLLILGDANKNYRPTKYERKVVDSRLSFEYKLVKLIDYDKKKLEKSKNVFAMITLSHLKALEAGSNIEKKKIFKIELVRKFHKKGYNTEEICNLHKFIDWLIRLPIEDEKEILEEIKKTEEVIKMPMILTAERIARDEERKKAEIKIKKAESKRRTAESKIKTAENKIKTAESKFKTAESKIRKMITNLIKEGYDKLRIKELSGLSDRELNRLLPQT
jgi:hypothetical protein